MKKIVKFRYWILVVFCVFVCVDSVFATPQAAPQNEINVNTLSIRSTTDIGRYFCDLNFAVSADYNGGGGFANCQYVLLYDSLNSKLSYLNRGAFSATDTNSGTGNLWFVEEKNDKVIRETVDCSKFKVKPISTNVSGSWIRFVDKDGNRPSDSTFTNTNDLLNLSYNGTDTLTGVKDLYIEYELCPCNLDNDTPKFVQFSHNFSANSHYTGEQTITFLVYDKGGSSWSYWTSGTALNHVMENGLPYAYTGGAPVGMDNQEGIDPKTIKVILNYPNSSQVLTPGNGGLTITRYTGTISNTPEYTWDGNDRGYRVSFTGNFDVEIPVSISIEAADNVLSNGTVCRTDSHTGTYSATINAKQAPEMSLITPGSNSTNINPNSLVTVQVSDSWAGVNTGSVKITIPAIYSGGDLLMTGYTYSGSDLSFDLIEGNEDLGGASKYHVSFQPKYNFPTNTGIRITGYVEDFVGMSGNMNRNFSTRADCSFYGCVNYVDIFFGDFSIENLQIGQFTGSLIVVTGTIAPYPYLTGENNDIVMCGPLDETIILSGNVDIYNDAQIINGQEYSYSGLYITGLDFEYDPESGVITIIY